MWQLFIPSENRFRHLSRQLRSNGRKSERWLVFKRQSSGTWESWLKSWIHRSLQDPRSPGLNYAEVILPSLKPMQNRNLQLHCNYAHTASPPHHEKPEKVCVSFSTGKYSLISTFICNAQNKIKVQDIKDKKM